MGARIFVNVSLVGSIFVGLLFLVFRNWFFT
jgi:hypothetical protein